MLTPAQEDAVQRQERQLRMAWNKLVNWQRCSLRDWRFGRRTQLLAEMRAILDGKLLVGNAMVKAAERANRDGISREDAVKINRQEAVARKERYGPRRLGVELAQERLMASADYFFGGQKSLLYGMIQKFQKSCENWLKLKGTAQAPRYKRSRESVALQRQIKDGAVKLGEVSDLSAMIGQSGKFCRVKWHRALPDQHVVKQIAITGRINRRFLVVFFTCSRASVAKPFGKSEAVAGVDTGYKCALTVVSNAYGENRKLRRDVLSVEARLEQKMADDPASVEGRALSGALVNLERFIFSSSNKGIIELQPKLSRDAEFLKRLRRLQRQMDRQKRAANKDCFNSDGTWKKGKKAKVVTNNLLKTHLRIQRMYEHMADARRDFYHVAAYKLLKDHGQINVGNWRPPQLKKESNPVPKGMAKRRRNMNRKGLDHALSSFTGILQDKASISFSPRIVNVVQEAYTTQTCACCKGLTGPVGPTDIVNWICSACGVENHRKANAAENIRQISPATAGVTAGAQPVAAAT